MTNGYSFWISLKKAIKYPIVIFIGLLIGALNTSHPEITGLTVGGLLTLLYDWLKNGVGARLP